MKKFFNMLMSFIATIAVISSFILATDVKAASTVAVPNCATRPAVADKLVTRSKAYESKDAVVGDQITVTFTSGITTASTICITSGTKSVATGVKALVSETDIPAGATVTLIYDGTQYKIAEKFTLLANLNGSGIKEIPSGTNFVNITGLYKTATAVDDYGDQATAVAKGTVELLDEAGSSVGAFTGRTGTVTIQNLGVEYPSARSFKIKNQTDTVHTAGDHVPATASAQPSIACYSVGGKTPSFDPTIPGSNLTLVGKSQKICALIAILTIKTHIHSTFIQIITDR